MNSSSFLNRGRLFLFLSKLSEVSHFQLGCLICWHEVDPYFSFTGCGFCHISSVTHDIGVCPISISFASDLIDPLSFMMLEFAWPHKFCL